MMYGAEVIVIRRSQIVLNKLQQRVQLEMKFHVHQLNFLKMLKSSNKPKYYN